MNTIRKMMCALLVSAMGIGTMNGTTAAKGIFSVAKGKTVQFADANEPNLVQWSTAYAWREEQKNEDGHNGWYVLNHEEWSYLLAYGRTNAAILNNLGIVNGQYGLIILPDGWVQPSGMQAVWEIPEEGWGVESIQHSAISIQKELHEGQIVLIIDGKQYDVTGKKL